MPGPAALQMGAIEEVMQAISTRIWLAVGVVLLGIVLGWLVGKVNRRLLERAGVPGTIEGTAFERTAREFGTSTVSIIARLSAYFIIILALIVAMTVAQISYASQFWGRVAGFLPNLFAALLVVIIGIVVGDKVELMLSERLRGVKLPEAGMVPTVAKYSVFYIAAVIALDQIGVAIFALVVLLAFYAIAVVLFGVVAAKDLLTAAAAGTYLLLKEPIGIGDEVRIGGDRGIVQEVEFLVTHVESNGEEYIIPNNRVFSSGIVRIRE